MAMQKVNETMEVIIDAADSANTETFYQPIIATKQKAQVSVVIPTYERIEDLSDLLVSILQQTVKPFEVIVVDDTPSDAIRNKCEECESQFEKNDVKLFYLRNPGSQSLTLSRNLGVNLAKGDFITFLDSDVVLEPDYIERIVQVFKENPEALAHKDGSRICQEDDLFRSF